MKRFYSQFRIMLMTFALGLASVFVFGVCQEINHSLNNSKALINPDKGKAKIIKLPFVIEGRLEEIEIDDNEAFTLLGHACGNGYVDGYITSDGERLSSGLEPIKPMQFKREISKTVIIERVESFENRDGEKGTRFILKGRNGKSGKDFYEIDWYDNKDEKRYIVAPSLELALKFEEWQKTQR